MTTIDRRQALIGLTIASATATMGVAAQISDLFDAADPAGVLSSVIKNTASARALGKAYLQKSPEEADAQTLVGLLGSAPFSKEALRSAIARDIEAGDLVNVAGCFMARTEARLCALVALRA